LEEVEEGTVIQNIVKLANVGLGGVNEYDGEELLQFHGKSLTSDEL
jgi:hypothetical protein